jgi:hypothetical protein
VVVFDEGAVGALPAAADVLQLEVQAGVGFEGGLFEEALGGGNAAVGGGEEGVFLEGLGEGGREGERLLGGQRESAGQGRQKELAPSPHAFSVTEFNSMFSVI